MDIDDEQKTALSKTAMKKKREEQRGAITKRRHRKTINAMTFPKKLRSSKKGPRI